MYLYKNNTICNCSFVEVSDETFDELYHSATFENLFAIYIFMFILSLIANSILFWFLVISAQTCCNSLLLSYTIGNLILTLISPLSNQLIVYSSSFAWDYSRYASLIYPFTTSAMMISVMLLNSSKYELLFFKKISRAFAIFKVLVAWSLALVATLLTHFDFDKLFYDSTTPEIVPCDCANLPVDRLFEVYYMPLHICFFYLVIVALLSLIQCKLWYLVRRERQIDQINCREIKPHLSCMFSPLANKSVDQAQDLERKSVLHAILISAVTCTFFLLLLPLGVMTRINLFRQIYVGTFNPTVTLLLQLACSISTPIYFYLLEPQFAEALRMKLSCHRRDKLEPALVQY